MGNYSNAIPNIQIESLLSVSPSKFTDPRQVRHVLPVRLDVDPFGSDILGGCLSILLYYNRACQDDSGWLHAGWIKESLGIALLEQPIFCGRLRKMEAADDKRLEIVSNDSGIRLVEARMPVTLSEFLGSNTCREAETQLVFWKDIDTQDPDFSPLFYLQVTNFECGGYSFGISCSLLLADLLFKENFLKRWAEIHNTIMLSSTETKSPIHYLPKFKRDGSSLPGIFGSSPSKKSGQTMIFNVRNSEKELKITNSLALLCVEEVESKLGDDQKMANSEYVSLFVNEPENVKVDKCSKLEIVKAKLSLENMGVTSSSWDEIEAYEMEFREGNKPIHVSFWIGSVSDDQIVMAIPSNSEKGISGGKIIVSVPCAKQI